MTDCCSSEIRKPGKPRYVCPVNGVPYPQVPYETVKQHLNPQFVAGLVQQSYYFCHDPDCDIVYFGEDDRIIDKTMMRTRVGLKENAEDAQLCYCFNITKSQAMADENLKQFVIEKTKSGECDCESKNPSGRCCLKDFPKTFRP